MQWTVIPFRISGDLWSTYHVTEGEVGAPHLDFKVAHKGGEPCPVYGGIIERVSVQNHGAYFCPRCQCLGHRPLYKRWPRLDLN
jgi:formamidopyrimidine-DNA glycosylase